MVYEPMVDTLRIAERLEGAGTPSEQARMLASVLAELFSAERKRVYARCVSRHEFTRQMALIRTRLEQIDAKIERLATEVRSLNERISTEIKSLEERVSADAHALEQRLELKIQSATAEVRESLVRWVVTVGLLQSALVTALILMLLK